MTNEAIERAAAKLLLSINQHVLFPVDLFEVMQFLNINYIKTDLKGESGYIMAIDEQYLICIDDTGDYGLNHQRFTLAHEIGHIVLGHLSDRACLPYYVIEHEANYFAGALLMPFHHMVAYRHYWHDVLASLFLVSEEALSVRKQCIKKDKYFLEAIQNNYYKEDLIHDYRFSLDNAPRKEF